MGHALSVAISRTITAGEFGMSNHSKDELEQMLFDVVNELDLSDVMLEVHGPLGTAPAILVRLVLEQKNRQIAMLRAGFVEIVPTRK